MPTSLYALFSLVRFPTGRRIFALRRIAEEARALGSTDLVTQILAAIEDDKGLHKLEAKWRGQPQQRNQHGPQARVLDQRLDRLLSGIKGAIDLPAKLYAEGHATQRAAKVLNDALFPAGLADILNLSYVEQFEEVGRMLDEIRDDATVAQAVEVLNLQEPMGALPALSERYRAELQQDQAIPFAQVQAARERGHENFAQIIGALIALNSPVLLTPILAQNERLKEQFRGRRRQITDVDPETGEEQSAVVDFAEPEPEEPRSEAA